MSKGWARSWSGMNAALKIPVKSYRSIRPWGGHEFSAMGKDFRERVQRHNDKLARELQAADRLLQGDQITSTTGQFAPHLKNSSSAATTGHRVYWSISHRSCAQGVVIHLHPAVEDNAGFGDGRLKQILGMISCETVCGPDEMHGAST